MRRIFTIVLLLTAAQPALADYSIRRNILENCSRAREQLTSLSEVEKRNLLPYLALVLRMELSALGEAPHLPIPRPTAPFSPLDTFPGTQLSWTLEPDRELQAKRCAVEILRQLGAAAVDTLPDLISLLPMRTVPADLRFQVEETIRAIATSSGGAVALAPESLRSLIELLDGESALYAEHVLVELERLSLDRLLEELRKADGKRRDQIAKVLLRVDRHGERLGPKIAPLLDSADDSLRKRALRMLAEFDRFYASSISLVLARLDDVSPDVSRAAFEALERIGRENQLPLPDLTIQQLLANLPRARDPILNILQRTLAGKPEALPVGRQLASAADSVIRISGVSLLAGIPDAHPILVDRLYDPIFAVRLNAVEALGALPGRSRETIAALTKLLKNAALDRISRNSLLRAISSISLHLDLQTGSSLLPLLAEALALESDADPHPAVLAFVRAGEGAVPSLIKLLRSPEEHIRRQALDALGRISPLDRKEIRSIVSLLRDPAPAVQAEASEALIRIGEKVLPDIHRSGRTFPGDVVRHALGESVSEEEIFAGLKATPCPARVSFAEVISSGKGVRLSLVRFTRECFPAAKEEFLAHLLRVSPLTEKDTDEVLAVVKDPPTALKLFERYSNLVIPPQRLVPTIVRILRESENAVRIRALSLLGRMGSDARDAVGVLREIFESGGEEELLRHEALVALAKISPQAVPFHAILLDALRGEQVKWAIEALRKLPPRDALSIIEDAVRLFSEERLVLLIPLVGELGAEGSSFAPVLVNLATRPNSLLRFHAAVSLAKVDPGNASLSSLLERELGGFYGQLLLREKFPEAVRMTIQAITPTSRVAELTQQELLVR